MDIEQRISNLENLVYSFMKNQNKSDNYKKYDIESCSKITSENSDSINETNIGLIETYEETQNNSSSITELELALEEVYEMMGE